jgi:hypothetical protein
VFWIFFNDVEAEQGGIKRFGALDITDAKQDMTEAFELDYIFPLCTP